MQVLKPSNIAAWLPTLALALAMVFIMLGGETASQWLRYDSVALNNGELWRLLTAHLTHLGWSHLLLNMAGLFLLQALVGDVLSRSGWLLLMVFSALLISGGLWLFEPQLRWYVGLSGVLHGVLLGGALLMTLVGSREGIYLLLLILAKLLWEQLVGPLPGSEATAGGKVIVNAHLYGAIAGGLFVMALWGRGSWRKRFLQLH